MTSAVHSESGLASVAVSTRSFLSPGWITSNSGFRRWYRSRYWYDLPASTVVSYAMTVNSGAASPDALWAATRWAGLNLPSARVPLAGDLADRQRLDGLPVRVERELGAGRRADARLGITGLRVAGLGVTGLRIAGTARPEPADRQARP